MPQLGQAQTGSLRSTPKQLSMTTSDKHALIFRNMGNNHNMPFIWSTTATILTGATEVVVATGVKFYDMELATAGNFYVTPTEDPGSRYWVDANTGTNVVKIKLQTAPAADITFNVQCILGNTVDISKYHTRGTGAPQQSLP